MFYNMIQDPGSSILELLPLCSRDICIVTNSLNEFSLSEFGNGCLHFPFMSHCKENLGMIIKYVQRTVKSLNMHTSQA